MWEPTLHGGLKRKSAAVDMPGSIFQLRGEKEAPALLKRRMRDRDATSSVQRKDSFAGCIGIAPQRRQLGPATVTVLLCEQAFGSFVKGIRRLAGPRQAKQLKHAAFMAFRFGGSQPSSRALNSLRKLDFAPG